MTCDLCEVTRSEREADVKCSRSVCEVIAKRLRSHAKARHVPTRLGVLTFLPLDDYATFARARGGSQHQWHGSRRIVTRDSRLQRQFEVSKHCLVDHASTRPRASLYSTIELSACPSTLPDEPSLHGSAVPVNSFQCVIPEDQ